MSEERDTSHIWAKINSYSSKITTYTNAKTSVQTVKTTCESQIQNWETSYNTLANNADLTSVKKTDVFEGEMADSLSQRVADIMSDISSGLSKAGELNTALSTQITRLETKIEQLNSSRNYWYNQL